MAVSTLACSVDLEEYSIYESDKDTVKVSISATGTSLAGELVTVQLGKARRNRDVFIATEQVTLTGTTTSAVSATFKLKDVKDGSNLFYKARRGSYFIKVISVSSPSVNNVSSDFLISLITVDKLKRDYLFGAHLKAFEVLSPHNQPQSITGVTITGVSLGHPQMMSALTYDYNDPGGGGNIIRLLSWCSGPAVTIRDGVSRYTLQHGDSNSYIDVSVSVGMLPTSTMVEKILIERAVLSDDKIRSHLNEAISWVEDSELKIFLEPTNINTESNPNISYSTGSDIPTLLQYDVDKIVNALDYRYPSSGHWINFRMPYFPIIRFNTLFGKVSNIHVIDIPQEFIEVKTEYGHVDLVPFNQEISFNFLGLAIIQGIRGSVPIPNFWNFDAIAGFRETPPVLLELIAKKAAMDLLTIAGLAYRGNVQSTSLSRDGVSESVGLFFGTFGPYSGPIMAYKTWIDENLIKLRGAFRGPNLAVL